MLGERWRLVKWRCAHWSDHLQFASHVIDSRRELVDLVLLEAGGELEVPLVFVELVDAIVVILAQLHQSVYMEKSRRVLHLEVRRSYLRPCRPPISPRQCAR